MVTVILGPQGEGHVIAYAIPQQRATRTAIDNVIVIKGMIRAAARGACFLAPNVLSLILLFHVECSDLRPHMTNALKRPRRHHGTLKRSR